MPRVARKKANLRLLRRTKVSAFSGNMRAVFKLTEKTGF